MKKISAMFTGLALMTSAVAEEGSTLSLLAYTAPTPLDWSTPGTLVRSTLANSTLAVIGRMERQNGFDEDGRPVVQNVYAYRHYPHAISHINVELKCRNQETILTGKTGLLSSFEYLSRWLFQGSSLDTLILDTPGSLIRKEAIEGWLGPLTERDMVRKLTFKINDSMCAYLTNYLEEYKKHRLDRSYGGLDSFPLRGKGGGCAAFGMSFLQVAGFNEPLFDETWARELKIPNRYVSRRERLAERGFYSFVFWRRNGNWSNTNQDSVPLRFWDPQKLYDWLGRAATSEQAGAGSYEVRPWSKEKMLEITYDRTDRQASGQPYWDENVFQDDYNR